ncbi:hypothetical protein Anapl_14112 [Anas platyrhynchos]|uniref:Uncharacterized protein n=1 Tax=Anas platyrhynchos TaxID=8839 RepID=R0LLL5_ANAPL|nr:hypothetical protein Anapl_14112 [Anas platyrhynchos]
MGCFDSTARDKPVPGANQEQTGQGHSTALRRLQPASSDAARRARSSAADGAVINLIVTSTALNVRLAQEAHKRKLSAVTWALLLREQGKQTNKSQRYLRLEPADDKASPSSTAGLFASVFCHWGDMAWYNPPGDSIQLVLQWDTTVSYPLRKDNRITLVLQWDTTISYP